MYAADADSSCADGLCAGTYDITYSYHAVFFLRVSPADPRMTIFKPMIDTRSISVCTNVSHGIIISSILLCTASSRHHILVPAHTHFSGRTADAIARLPMHFPTRNIAGITGLVQYATLDRRKLLCAVVSYPSRDEKLLPPLESTPPCFREARRMCQSTWIR